MLILEEPNKLWSYSVYDSNVIEDNAIIVVVYFSLVVVFGGSRQPPPMESQWAKDGTALRFVTVPEERYRARHTYWSRPRQGHRINCIHADFMISQR